MDAPTVTTLSNAVNTPTDDARQMLSQEARQHEHYTLDHKGQSATYPPIERLPPELLLQVFSVLTEDGRRGDSMRCIPITRVCRRWRVVALGTPDLWTQLSSSTRQWTRVMLERSERAPLTVFMDNMSFDQVSLVLKHLSRIKSFTINNWSTVNLQELYALIQDNSSAAPLLEALSIICYKRPTSSQWVMPSTTFQQTDRLRNLFLEAVSIDWSESPLLRNLTKLNLHSMDYPPTWRQLIAILNQMPALKSLSIDDAFPFNRTLDAAVATLPHLENLVLRSVPDIDIVMTFMTQVNLPADLKVFAVVDINGYPSSEEFRRLFHIINRSLPRLGSKARYMNIAREADAEAGSIFIGCSSTFRDKFHERWFDVDFETDPPDIGLDLFYTCKADRATIIVDALGILDLAHITHLRMGKYSGDPELPVLLERLSELQMIQVYGQATVHLVQSLNEMQTSAGREGALILPKLTELRVCNDYDPMRQLKCLFTDDTWQTLKTFLEQRQSLQAGIHRLCMDKCRNVSKEMVAGLKKCVGELCRDGIRQEPE